MNANDSIAQADTKSSTHAEAFIGIGSNLGDPLKQLQDGLSALDRSPQLERIAASSIYRSAPLGGIEQPDFFNAVCKIRTTLNPWQLLRQLQDIEVQAGRVRAQRWGSRTLDLDILVFGSRTHSDLHLQLPHPGIYMRNFVLLPMAELSPHFVFPDGSKIEQRIKSCPEAKIEVVEVNESRA